MISQLLNRLTFNVLFFLFVQIFLLSPLLVGGDYDRTIAIYNLWFPGIFLILITSLLGLYTSKRLSKRRFNLLLVEFSKIIGDLHAEMNSGGTAGTYSSKLSLMDSLLTELFSLIEDIHPLTKSKRKPLISLYFSLCRIRDNLKRYLSRSGNSYIVDLDGFNSYLIRTFEGVDIVGFTTLNTGRHDVSLYGMLGEIALIISRLKVWDYGQTKRGLYTVCRQRVIEKFVNRDMDVVLRLSPSLAEFLRVQYELIFDELFPKDIWLERE